MIGITNDKLTDARLKLKEINTTDDNTNTMILSLTKSMDDISTRINEQKEFVKQYLSKGKMGRKSMFYTKN